MLNVSQGGSSSQLYFDQWGQIFARAGDSSPGIFSSQNDWKKAVMERIGYSTVLVEKLALARTKLKSYSKTERNALTNKEVGEIIWQTDAGNSGVRVYDGTNWLALQTTID